MNIDQTIVESELAPQPASLNGLLVSAILFANEGVSVEYAFKEEKIVWIFLAVSYHVQILIVLLEHAVEIFELLEVVLTVFAVRPRLDHERASLESEQLAFLLRGDHRDEQRLEHLLAFDQVAHVERTLSSIGPLLVDSLGSGFF